MRAIHPIKAHRESCREARAHMSEHLDGELDGAARAEIERHLRWCPNCRRMLRNLGRTVGGLRRLGDESER